MRAYKVAWAALMMVFAGFGYAATAQAGTVILEGSDAIGYHCPSGNSGACTYRDEAWTAIGASDPRPIAVIGDVAGIGSGTHAVQDYSTVADAITAGGSGGLNSYVALYFLAGGGCCSENDSLITASGAETAVSAYLTAGGTVMIENYIGGAAWDFAVGAGGNGNANVAGVGGGYSSSLSCSDGETVTALGSSNGFVQPPALGCWTHQGYDQSFFGPLGFTNSFFNSPTGLGIDGFSSLLSNGSTVTVTEGVPEPVSLALLGAGVAGLALARRRGRRQA